MKHSVVKKLLCGILAGISACTMVACGGGGPNGPDNHDRPTDTSKTQVELFNYEAGYGREWVDSLISRFEEAVKDVSFEEGKKGVQVWYNGAQQTFKSQEISSAPYHVFFNENCDYYELRRAGVLVSVNDIVKQNDLTLWDGSSLKTQLEAAGYPLDNSVESKLIDQQKAFYTGDGTNDYFAVPSYMSTWGIIYDVELFDEEGLYVVDAHDGNFHLESDIGYEEYDRTVGPNGKAGDYDDGLPRTYDEFWSLCTKMKNKNLIPIAWSGKHELGYLSSLGFNLLNTALGSEQMMLNYTFKGLAKDLIKVSGNGEFVFDAQGNPVTEDVDITTIRNGYETFRSSGVYYMVDFLKNLLDQNVSYYDDTIRGNNFSHTDTQRAFIEWGHMNGRKKIGMLEDGLWWLRETIPSKNKVYGDSSNFLKTHKYGWLPLPYPTEEMADRGLAPVLADSLNAFGCIKSGVSAGVRDACKALLLFSCTDASCLDFTVKTGSPKGLEYDVPESVKADLPEFTKQFIQFLNEADKVYNFSGLDFYNSNKATFQPASRFAATVRGKYQKSVIDGYIYDSTVPSKEYAEDIYATAKSFFTTYSWTADQN